jgi:serine kinase of HPr protein (carbohydrate metabolism regulator)
MSQPMSPSIHASCVLWGSHAILIRGPSGAGKSRLALRLLQAAEGDRQAFARLVSDDRTILTQAHLRVLARPPAEIAGLIEVRGLGICRMPYEPVAQVGLVVDLAAGTDRLPATADQTVRILHTDLPRLAVADATDPMPQLMAALQAPMWWLRQHAEPQTGPAGR